MHILGELEQQLGLEQMQVREQVCVPAGAGARAGVCARSWPAPLLPLLLLRPALAPTLQ